MGKQRGSHLPMTLGVQRTPDGYRVEISRYIDAPREVLWDLLTDTTRWPDWGPSVEEVVYPDRYIRCGERGRVRVSDGLGGVWVPFQITSCSDYRWTWSVSPPTLGLGAFDLAPRVPATGHRVERTPPYVGRECDTSRTRHQSTQSATDNCRVVFEIPPLAAGYAIICERALIKLDRIAARETVGEK